MDTSDRICIVKGCSTKHLNKRGQAVNTLALCNIFKGLNLKDKLDYMKVGKCCYTCTTPGHNSKACKSTSTCQAKGTDNKICGSKAHHTLLHREVVAGGAKQAAKGKIEAYSTGSCSTGSCPKTGVEVPPTSAIEPTGAIDMSAPQKEVVEVTEVLFCQPH